MSGSIQSNLPRGTEVLRQMIQEDSYATKVDASGRVSSSATMALASGLRLVFGRAKPEDDVRTNQETLRNVLRLVEEEARAEGASIGKRGGEDPATSGNKFARKVMDEVLNAQTRLLGDKRDYSVAERLSRGTYVSGELAGRILYVAREAIRETRDEMTQASQRAAERRANLDRYKDKNQDAVNRFLGRPLQNGSVNAVIANAGAAILDGAKSLFARVAGFGEPRTPFEALVDDIAKKGAPGYPPTNEHFWATFKDIWKSAARDPQHSVSPLLRSFEIGVKSMAVSRAAQGQELKEDWVAERLEGRMMSPKYFSAIAEEANRRLVHRELTEDMIIGAVQAWRETQPPDVRDAISQNDCDWLANELWLAKDEDRLLSMPPRGLSGTMRDRWDQFMRPAETIEKHGAFALYNRIADAIRTNYDAAFPSPDMTARERLNFYRKKCAKEGGDDLDAVRQWGRPKPLDAKALGALIGNAIKPALEERHERMKPSLAAEAGALASARAELRGNLAPYPVLLKREEQYKDQLEVTANKPTSAKDFIKSIGVAPAAFCAVREKIGELRAQRQPPALAPLRGGESESVRKAHANFEAERGKASALLEAELAVDTAIALRTAREVFEASFEKFDVLDQYVGFERDLAEEMRKANVKVPDQLDEAVLKRLDARCEALRDEARDMVAFSMNLMERFRFTGPDEEVVKLAGAAWSAAANLESGLDAYASQSLKVLRDMNALQVPDFGQRAPAAARPSEARREVITNPFEEGYDEAALLPDAPRDVIPPKVITNPFEEGYDEAALDGPPIARERRAIEQEGAALAAQIRSSTRSEVPPDLLRRVDRFKEALVAAEDRAAREEKAAPPGEGGEALRREAGTLRQQVDRAAKAIVEFDRGRHTSPGLERADVKGWSGLAGRHDWRQSEAPLEERPGAERKSTNPFDDIPVGGKNDGEDGTEKQITRISMKLVNELGRFGKAVDAAESPEMRRANDELARALKQSIVTADAQMAQLLQQGASGTEEGAIRDFRETLFRLAEPLVEHDRRLRGDGASPAAVEGWERIAAGRADVPPAIETTNPFATAAPPTREEVERAAAAIQNAMVSFNMAYGQEDYEAAARPADAAKAAVVRSAEVLERAKDLDTGDMGLKEALSTLKDGVRNRILALTAFDEFRRPSHMPAVNPPRWEEMVETHRRQV